MKFDMRFFVSSSLLMSLSAVSAFAQQSTPPHAQANPQQSIITTAKNNQVIDPTTNQAPTVQQIEDTTAAGAATMMGGNVANAQKLGIDLMDKPIKITIDVGARTDEYKLYGDGGFYRLPGNANSSVRMSASIPVLNQCGASYPYKGAHPDASAVMRMENNQLVDTFTLNDEAHTTYSAALQLTNNGLVFSDSAKSSLEAAQQKAILDGLAESVEGLNATLDPLGYKVDLQSAVVSDSRTSYYNNQQDQLDPNDPCSKLDRQANVTQNEQNNPNLDSFGTTSYKQGNNSFFVSFNHYTITITVKPSKK